MAIIAIVLAVAIPLLSKARLSAEETMVVREMHTIGQAQTQYQSQFGKYAATLGGSGSADEGRYGRTEAAHLIPVTLASGEKNGYVFTMTSQCRRVTRWWQLRKYLGVPVGGRFIWIRMESSIRIGDRNWRRRIVRSSNRGE